MLLFYSSGNCFFVPESVADCLACRSGNNVVTDSSPTRLYFCEFSDFPPNKTKVFYDFFFFYYFVFSISLSSFVYIFGKFLFLNDFFYLYSYFFLCILVTLFLYYFMFFNFFILFM